MNNIQRFRFLKLIDHLERMDPINFYFGLTVTQFEIDDQGNQCGTVCCAIGETPKMFPDLVKYDNGNVRLTHMNNSNYDDIAAELFGFSLSRARSLFTPYCQSEVHPNLRDLSNNCKPKELAEVLREFLKLHDSGEIG